MTDAGLKELAGLKSLQTLDVRGTQVTDAGLKVLARLQSLQRLYLNHCLETDAGMKDLASLTSLQILNISASDVTDAGLKELAGLKSLQSLIMWGTKATPAGIAALRFELPKCRIDDQLSAGGGGVAHPGHIDRSIETVDYECVGRADRSVEFKPVSAKILSPRIQGRVDFWAQQIAPFRPFAQDSPPSKDARRQSLANGRSFGENPATPLRIESRHTGRSDYGSPSRKVC